MKNEPSNKQDDQNPSVGFTLSYNDGLVVKFFHTMPDAMQCADMLSLTRYEIGRWEKKSISVFDLTQKACHCGRPVHIESDGFTRNMCKWCSEVRCDLSEEGFAYDCENQK